MYGSWAAAATKTDEVPYKWSRRTHAGESAARPGVGQRLRGPESRRTRSVVVALVIAVVVTFVIAMVVTLVVAVVVTFVIKFVRASA